MRTARFVVAAVLASAATMILPLAQPAGATPRSSTVTAPVTCVVDGISVPASLELTVLAPASAAVGHPYRVSFTVAVPAFSPTPRDIFSLTQDSTWDLEGNVSPSSTHQLVQGPQDYPSGSTVVAETFTHRVTPTGSSGDLISYVFDSFSYTFQDLPAGPTITGVCTLDGGPATVASTIVR